MGVIDLCISARFEGVKQLQTGSDFRWFVYITCTTCRQPHPKPVSIDQSSQLEAQGSRGAFNLSIRCKMCKAFMNANITSTSPCSYSETQMPLASVEIRGLEIDRWEARDGFTIISEADDVLEDQDLTAGDWCEYAENFGNVVGVYDVETSVRRK